MKKIIILLLSFVFGSGLIFAQVEAPKTVRQLAAEISVTKDVPQKNILLAQLRKLKPQSAKDVKDLLEVAHISSNKELKESALAALINVDPKDRSTLALTYIKALDESDWATRITIISAVGRLEATEAAPKLREILKEKPRRSELAILATGTKEDNKIAWRINSSPAIAATVLGELKDEESIPLLVNKYADLEETAMGALADIGRKSIPALLNLANKEKGSASPATLAFAQISDKSAKGDLIEIVKTEKKWEIRGNALTALTMFMYDADVLATAKELYKNEKNPMFLFAMANKNGIEFLGDVVKNSADFDSKECAIVLLERIGDRSAEPVLMEALKDKNKKIQRLSAHALKKLTGKNYDLQK